jgi:hypothetical protein
MQSIEQDLAIKMNNNSFYSRKRNIEQKGVVALIPFSINSKLVASPLPQAGEGSKFKY